MARFEWYLDPFSPKTDVVRVAEFRIKRINIHLKMQNTTHLSILRTVA